MVCNLTLKYVKDFKHQRGRKCSKSVQFDEEGSWSFKSAKSSNVFTNNIQLQYLTGERLDSYKIYKILFSKKNPREKEGGKYLLNAMKS